MIDIVERLRDAARFLNELEDFPELQTEAATEITCMREENARLREAVRNAYYEGWQDRESIVATEDRLHFDWESSEACAAIREGGK